NTPRRPRGDRASSPLHGERSGSLSGRPRPTREASHAPVACSGHASPLPGTGFRGAPHGMTPEAGVGLHERLPGDTAPHMRHGRGAFPGDTAHGMTPEAGSRSPNPLRGTRPNGTTPEAVSVSATQNGMSSSEPPMPGSPRLGGMPPSSRPQPPPPEPPPPERPPPPSRPPRKTTFVATTSVV